jgi:thymidylate synthase (FAD)
MSIENKNRTIILNEYPSIHPDSVSSTENGTLYLKEPGVVLLSAPAVNVSGMQKFLDGFPEEYGFSHYLEDPTELTPDQQLIKIAGQVCYASFGPKRTWNENVDEYVMNLIKSSHGSVLTHANYSVFLYGISRSCSHEIVRHAAGTGYSQLSQRYVSGRVLRFVERKEFQSDPVLHSQFEKRIDESRARYEEIAERLLELQQSGYEILSADQKTDLRKKVQQTARAILPNETETTMVMTGNIRAWRHIFNMRASEHAETEIRKVMFNTFQILNKVAPTMFQDFEVVNLPDGTQMVKTDYPKV